MNYLTVAKAAEDFFIEKKSKFIGSLCPVKTEEEAVEWAEARLQDMVAARMREQGATGDMQYQIEKNVTNVNDLKVSTKVVVTATA